MEKKDLPLLVDDGTNGYLHAGGLIAEITGGGVPACHLTDVLGSVRGLADLSGTVTGSSDYAILGSPRNQSGATSRFGFTGEPTDATTGVANRRAGQCGNQAC